MNRVLFLTSCMLFLSQFYAENWQALSDNSATNLGSLDTDSIKKYNSLIYYRLKLSSSQVTEAKRTLKNCSYAPLAKTVIYTGAEDCTRNKSYPALKVRHL
jgi:hypothetical protein